MGIMFSQEDMMPLKPLLGPDNGSGKNTDSTKTWTL